MPSFPVVIVKRFYDVKLAQTSYLIACGRVGVAVVIDPIRDVEPYIHAAEAEGVRITHVTETHIHADFVSGARDLARRTGATLYLSDEGDAKWKYAYARDAGAVLVHDGDEFTVGNVKVRVVHTPGHTPEHIAFLITDTAAADEPIGIVTGDFVFVGDVGRPDLLERAAKFEGTMVRAARTLFQSLQKFKQYPDWLQIWPGHGAGSACGKGLSAVPHSTVGYERRFNWAFAIADEDTFVRAVLEGQPEPPKYFAEMKRINKAGPAPFDAARQPPAAGAVELRWALANGTPVVDTRVREAFAAFHVSGTINIPLNKSFNTWAGWLVPFNREFLLIVDAGSVDEAVRELAMVGLDRAAGVIPLGVVEEWAAAGGATGSVPQIEPAALAALIARGDAAVVDVRGRSEWEAGHLPGVQNLPLGFLPDRLAELPRAKTLVMQCRGGGRSSIAASILLARGVKQVVNLAGGFEAWERAGLPVEPYTPATTT
jgi:hydroxyacylglutathione hydrolase